MLYAAMRASNLAERMSIIPRAETPFKQQILSRYHSAAAYTLSAKSQQRGILVHLGKFART
jgi:hypothetical protein